MKKVMASAGMLALGAAGAAAQMAASTDKPWTIHGSLRGFYDDNINTTATKQDSFGIETSPGIDFGTQWGPTTVKASYVYDNRYYFQRRTSDQSHDIELLFNHNFSERYSFGLTDSFVIAQEPQVLAGNSAVATPLRSNGNNLRNTAGLSFQAQITRLFGLVLGYNNTFYSYDENNGNKVVPNQPSRSALLDRVEHHANIDSTWSITELTTGVFGYAFGAVDYTSGENINSPQPSPFIASSTRNNYAHYVYVGLNHSFNPDFTGTVRVGLQYLDYYNAPAGTSKNSASPYADLSLNYAYANSGSLTFGFHHAHNQTDQAASALNPGAGITEDEESSVVFASLTQKLLPLSPNLTASLSAQYQNSQFNGGPVNSAVDSFYLFGVDLSYQFTHYLSADAGYNFDLLTSDISGRGYSRNQLFVGLTASY